MSPEGFPETQDEIQAATRTLAWVFQAERYARAFREGDVRTMSCVMAEICVQFGERMAAGLAEYLSEEVG